MGTGTTRAGGGLPSQGSLVAALLGMTRGAGSLMTGSLVAALLGMTGGARRAAAQAVIPSDSEGSRDRQAYEPCGLSSPGSLGAALLGMTGGAGLLMTGSLVAALLGMTGEGAAKPRVAGHFASSQFWPEPTSTAR